MAGSYVLSRCLILLILILFISCDHKFLDLNVHRLKLDVLRIRFGVYSGSSRSLLQAPIVAYCRHLGLQIQRKGFLSSRLVHTPTAISTFQLQKICISGDVEFNPGPVKCKSCNRTIAKSHRALRCDQCNETYHIKCGEVKPSEYRMIISSTHRSWSCPLCLSSSLSADLPFQDIGVI